MDQLVLSNIKEQLVEKRERLKKTITFNKDQNQLISLLKEVNAALERMDNGTYGICEICHDPIEEERLMVDPLIRFCLGDLNEFQQRSLEQDLELASQMQLSLLPKKNLEIDGWEIGFSYLPAGPVSGDYCDIIPLSNDEVLFVLGDVTGKGVSASLLMTQIHAIFHSLSAFKLTLEELLEQVNRLISETNSFSHFVTLIAGKLNKDGEIELVNAGHCLPVLLKKYEAINLDSSTVPMGLFFNIEYQTQKIKLEKDESLFLYTDGLSEARKNDEEYGEKRIFELTKKSSHLSPQELINTVINDLNTFTEGSKLSDDLTLMVIRKK